MFVFRKERTFDWPVTVSFPADGGKTEEQIFTARFSIRGSDLQAREIAERLADPEDGKRFLSDLWVGWDGIKLEDGNDLPFSEAARDQLLDDPFVIAGIAEALADCLSGARAKNSVRRPFTGRRP